MSRGSEKDFLCVLGGPRLREDFLQDVCFFFFFFPMFSVEVLGGLREENLPRNKQIDLRGPFFVAKQTEKLSSSGNPYKVQDLTKILKRKEGKGYKQSEKQQPAPSTGAF